MTLPRILVIDDLYGASRRGRFNRDRYDFCYRMKLRDITGDEDDLGRQTIEGPVAEAVFCSGQIEADGFVHNSDTLVLERLESGWRRVPRWALVLLDLHFKTGRVGPDAEPKGTTADRDPCRYFGLTLLKSLKAAAPDLAVVVLSSMDRDPIESQLSRGLADDFLAKDSASSRDLERLLWRHGLVEDARGVTRGNSIALLKALRAARRAAHAGNENTLVIGESGTGKELLARYIHGCSPWHQGPFVAVSLHTIPEELMAAELFGYEKGAFTGAKEAKAGYAEQAHHGTLFIDEFHNILVRDQVRFNRLLDRETREVQRTGPKARPRQVQLQIVVATNDLEIRRSDRYRADFLERITTEIVLPALRERTDDLQSLAEYFVRRAEERQEGAERGRTLEPEAIADLMTYTWPGNIRELARVTEKLVADYATIRVISAPQVRKTLQELAPAPGDSSQPPLTPVAAVPPPPAALTPGEGPLQPTLEAILAALERYTFRQDYDSLYGKLPEILSAMGRFLARYVKAGLLFRREPVPGRPEGRINFTGAIKCMTGQDLTTLQAADIFRRLLKLSPDVLEEARRDEVLGPVLEYAVRRRSSGERLGSAASDTEDGD